MFDIHWFMRVHEERKRILSGKKFSSVDRRKELLEYFEFFRPQEPKVFNVETTNLCNMKCSFCPRTTSMVRKNERMSIETFERVVSQIQPYAPYQLEQWRYFVSTEYGITPDQMSQDHFFFYIIPMVLTLHGFGEPLLDRDLSAKVALCTDRRIPTYFSCNPSNVKLDKTKEIIESGLNYIKFSIDSIDDDFVRGQRSKFLDNFKKIEALAELKEKNNYKDLTIVITMINLSGQNKEEWNRLQQIFKDMNIYIYLKDQDQVWHDGSKNENKSIDWNQFCCSPWYSMSILSDGSCVPCQEFYDKHIVFGNVKEQSLIQIWNGEQYKEFREKHMFNSSCNACSRPCDKRSVAEFVS